MGSLTPLYLARVASFVLETETMIAADVEERIERLCRTFDELKPYLVRRWHGELDDAVAAPVHQSRRAGVVSPEANLEV